MWPIIATVILVPTAQITNRSSILILVTTATGVLATLSFSLLWLLFDNRRDEGAVRWVGDVLRGHKKVSSLWAEAPSSPSRSALSFVTLFGCGSLILLGQLTILEGARLVAQSPPKTTVYGPALEALGIAVDENSLAIGILLILLGGFAMGVPSATVVKPPLPRVQLELHKEFDAKGWLVAHSDGFWHVFLAESRELQSIPDEKVRLARTGEEGQTPPAKKEAVPSEEAPPEEDAKPGAGEDG
jgi:hypothetical protein